ncbi:hypothetical protein BCD49_35255 [Pseudofrankia sp. EUN1h]|nr:hypothetical protein BCD49_35255 [Pseudofrankia sp. EUN1h]
MQQTRPPLDCGRPGGDLASMWSVQTLKKDDWSLLKDVRIRSLDTAADVLAGDLATFLDFQAHRWRDQIRHREWFVVREAGRPIAVAALNKSALTDPGECAVIQQPHAHIESMWVEPHLRRSGIASKLVIAAIEEVEKEVNKSRLIGLWVFENNRNAADAFGSMGFKRSGQYCQEYLGESEQERQRPPRREYHMHLDLGGQGVASLRKRSRKT